MKIIWIWNANKDKATATQHKNGEESFQKHDEYMRIFRLTHPRIETARCKDIVLPGELLVPVPPVKLNTYWQN